MFKLVELVIDESDVNSGIEAISIVESPAIQENFIALKDEDRVLLAEVDKEKRLLMGAALVPNKPIYRRDGDDEYYIYFTDDTVRKASELFLKKGNQKNHTLEHEKKIDGLTVVESWIVEDEQKDKSALYGLSAKKGTWMVSVKVDDDKIWNEQVKLGKVKGFSIEGYFADAIVPKQELKKEKTEEEILIEQIKKMLSGD